jgi:hypothetical protein
MRVPIRLSQIRCQYSLSVVNKSVHAPFYSPLVAFVMTHNIKRTHQLMNSTETSKQHACTLLSLKKKVL